MRTFVTQTSRERSIVNQRFPRGFSLLELLIVVSIVGILSGAVMLGFTGADAEQYLKGEAERFSIRVELARQHALQRNREWGIYIEAEAYQFAEFDPERGSWQKQSQRPFGVVNPFETITLKVETSGDILPMTDGEDLPQIIVFSSGEITPFEVLFEPDWNSSPWMVQSDGLSRAIAAREDGDVL